MDTSHILQNNIGNHLGLYVVVDDILGLLTKRDAPSIPQRGGSLIIVNEGLPIFKRVRLLWAPRLKPS